MAKLNKRSKAWQGKIDVDAQYAPADALGLVKECATTKFAETVDVSIKLGIDPRKSDQVVRGSSVLPNGTGKDVRVAVFAQGEAAEAAKAAGADSVGMEDLAESMQKGDINYGGVIAAPDAMRIVGQLGRVLGPRGLMPNPKVGTVTPDVATAVNNAKGGQVRFRADKAGNLHCTIGKATFDASALQENLEFLLADIQKLKPASAKGIYFKKISVSSTMGPGVVIEDGALV
jgi:large subunit ribosomal protein L1